MVLADVGVERFLVVGRFEVIQEPRHVPGDAHPPQFVSVSARALLQRDEQLARWGDVETAGSAVKDVEGVGAEIVSEELIEAEPVSGGNAGQPR